MRILLPIAIGAAVSTFFACINDDDVRTSTDESAVGSGSGCGSGSGSATASDPLPDCPPDAGCCQVTGSWDSIYDPPTTRCFSVEREEECTCEGMGSGCDTAEFHVAASCSAGGECVNDYD